MACILGVKGGFFGGEDILFPTVIVEMERQERNETIWRVTDEKIRPLEGTDYVPISPFPFMCEVADLRAVAVSAMAVEACMSCQWDGRPTVWKRLCIQDDEQKGSWEMAIVPKNEAIALRQDMATALIKGAVAKLKAKDRERSDVEQASRFAYLACRALRGRICQSPLVADLVVKAYKAQAAAWIALGQKESLPSLLGQAEEQLRVLSPKVAQTILYGFLPTFE